MEEEMPDTEMFSETESDQLLDVINIMNNEIEQLEEKVKELIVV